MKAKTTKKGEVQPAKPSAPKHGAASAAAAATPPVLEIETAETLEAKGWKRLTKIFTSHQDSAGRIWDDEILADLKGNLWFVSEWGNGARTFRSELKQISRERAVVLIAKASIPEEFHRDFRECDTSHCRLETAIQATAAFTSVLIESECLHRYGAREDDWLLAGIHQIERRVMGELKAAFYAGDFIAAENPTS